MKKQLFVALAIAFCIAGNSGFATDVGKPPAKIECSIAELAPANLGIQADQVNPYVISAFDVEFIAEVKQVETMNVVNMNELSPVVSMPKGDAAIPRSAQAQWDFYTLRSGPNIKELFPAWDYNLNRYWC